MHLRNFELEEPAHSSALKGLGLNWDLHAYAVLVDVHYHTIDNSVEFHLRAPDDTEHPPWGDERNQAKGCIMQFTKVSLLQMIQSDPNSANEDDCVFSISKISTTVPKLEEPPEYRMKQEWKTDEEFGLFFKLQSGRTIEIHSQSAELIAI